MKIKNELELIESISIIVDIVFTIIFGINGFFITLKFIRLIMRWVRNHELKMKKSNRRLA